MGKCDFRVLRSDYGDPYGIQCDECDMDILGVGDDCEDEWSDEKLQERNCPQRGWLTYIYADNGTEQVVRAVSGMEAAITAVDMANLPDVTVEVIVGHTILSPDFQWTGVEHYTVTKAGEAGYVAHALRYVKSVRARNDDLLDKNEALRAKVEHLMKIGRGNA